MNCHAAAIIYKNNFIAVMLVAITRSIHAVSSGRDSASSINGITIERSIRVLLYIENYDRFFCTAAPSAAPNRPGISAAKIDTET